jgi:hypothetical protein
MKAFRFWLEKKTIIVESTCCEKEVRVGETKIITAKIKVICVHTETYKNVPVNWQALLLYTTTEILIKRSPLSISGSNFYFLRIHGDSHFFFTFLKAKIIQKGILEKFR